MKKIYISVPISGRNIEDVESDIIFASAQIEKHGCKAVSPLEVSPNPDASYEEHIGNDITELLRCDAILLLDNWQQSKGCLLENQAALLYGKNQYYGINDFVNKINKKVQRIRLEESTKIEEDEDYEYSYNSGRALD